jgi:DNA-binding winged helix-turn-helix (wHTH) protein
MICLLCLRSTRPEGAAVNGNFRVGEFLVEPQINSITGAKKTLRIEPKVMQVLVCLAEHAGEVLLKEKLIQSVWSDTFVTDDVLTRSISELRKVFEDDAKDSRFIQTIPRSGYRLIAPVSDVEVKRSEDSEYPPAVGDVIPGAPAQRRLPGRRLIWIASVSVLVIAGSVLLYLLRDTSKSSLPALRVVPFTSLPGEEISPAFSPDGSQIAFSWGPGGPAYEIYVKLVGEGGPRQLTHSGKFNFSPIWSPNGQQIAFVRRTENEAALFTISAYGEQERRLLSFSQRGEGKISFESPDGRFVYYTKWPDVAGVWRVPFDGGEEILILDQLKSGMFGNWAAVDDGIYFIRFEMNTKEEAAILFFDFVTGRLKEIAKLGMVNIRPLGLAVSPDRSSFLYTVWEQSGAVDIMLVENFR